MFMYVINLEWNENKLINNGKINLSNNIILLPKSKIQLKYLKNIINTNII